jgi:arsenate reductase
MFLEIVLRCTHAPIFSYLKRAGKIKDMQSVQIFGVKSSQDARAAERFFKERRVQIHLVDLAQKPMSPGEIKRFIDRFGLSGLVDTDGKAYADAGLKYLKVSDTELLRKIEEQPKLLKLPLVRSGNRICIGRDEKAWAAMLEA